MFTFRDCQLANAVLFVSKHNLIVIKLFINTHNLSNLTLQKKESTDNKSQESYKYKHSHKFLTATKIFAKRI